MLRNFRSAKGAGGGAGSASGAVAAELVCDVESDALVGADRISSSGSGVTAMRGRTTMSVLTRMTDLVGGDWDRVFGCATGSARASFTVTTDGRTSRLFHHFQKNQ